MNSICNTNSTLYDTYNSLSAIKVYYSVTEFSDYVKCKLTKEAKEHFSDCTFVPLQIGVNEHDMSIEALIVPVKQPKWGD